MQLFLGKIKTLYMYILNANLSLQGCVNVWAQLYKSSDICMLLRIWLPDFVMSERGRFIILTCLYILKCSSFSFWQTGWEWWTDWKLPISFQLIHSTHHTGEWKAIGNLSVCSDMGRGELTELMKTLLCQQAILSSQ